MTREEASNILDDYDVNFDGHTAEEIAEAFDVAFRALEQEPCEDAISREDALMCMTGEYIADMTYKPEDIISKHIRRLRALPPVTPQETKWIPVSESLPKDLKPVNVTWINHSPKSYYADIKDKPFSATGVYFNGQWYWWSAGCTDILAEYSHNYADIIDDDIEITAWIPLPKPYEPQESEGQE